MGINGLATAKLPDVIILNEYPFLMQQPGQRPLRYLLHVDDDDDDANLLEYSIKRRNNQLILYQCRDGLEALNLLTTNLFSPDIIVLDLNMPGMNGFRFLEEIRKTDLFQRIPVIIFTTSASSKDKETALSLGANSFITKPNSISEFAEIVDVILDWKII
jgi:CheY-like chemotaxis protein